MIFAVTNGYVDDYPVEAVSKYEKELYVHLEANHGDILNEIREKKVISDDLKGKVVGALDDLKNKLGDFN